MNFRVELEQITRSTCVIEIDGDDDADGAVVEQFALNLAEEDDELEWLVSGTTLEIVSMTAVAELGGPV